MNFAEIINSAFVENLGWTLLHSVWQIGFVAFWLFLALRLSARSSANLRYLASLCALALAFIFPLLTFAFLSQNLFATRQISLNSGSENARVFDWRDEAKEADFSDKNKPSDETRENFLISVNDFQNGVGRQVSAATPVLVGFWLCGVLFFALRLTGGVRQLRVYKTRGISAPDEDWLIKFSDLCETLRIRQSVRFVQSSIVETPMVVGWLKPTILIPTAIFLRLKAKELETILAHELIHIRRHDYLVNFAQSFVEILFFYHPLVWWISAEVRRERECACDDAVVKVFKNSELVYAGALANLEEFRQSTKQETPSLLTAANGGKLMRRIERIVNKNTETSGGRASLWSASLAFMLISAVLTMVFSAGNGLSVNAESSFNPPAGKKIAVGFVSIPPLDRTANAPQDAGATARLLIEKLKAHRVPAIGFVQGGMISDGEKMLPARADVVRMWRDAGFEIGIGGYKHIWFYDAGYDNYVANTEKNEKIVREILAERNLPLRYFSYPFLNTGKTIEDKNRFEGWLKARGLRSIPYTVDNQEWMYSFAYEAARSANDVNLMKHIRIEFLDYMAKMLDHYEAYSKEMFGRDIAQTIVLSPSRLVADTADELFGGLAKRGYGFVSMDEALRDEAYRTEENFAGSKSGISWFERWTLTRGKKLRDEPRVSAVVSKIWEERRGK